MKPSDEEHSLVVSVAVSGQRFFRGWIAAPAAMAILYAVDENLRLVDTGVIEDIKPKVQ